MPVSINGNGSITGLVITTADLADGSVTTAKIAAGAVATVDIADSAVTTAKIADLNVTTAKIADSAITSGKIADGAVATVDIADSAVTTAKIADSAITTGKIADGAVATADIADSAVTTAKIANANVTVAKISATGTASSTTFLRGDGSWQAVSSTPTTDQVLTATAGATAGAVGTYAFCVVAANIAEVATGGTAAGSNLRYASKDSYSRVYFTGTLSFVVAGGTPSGTWRNMGYSLRSYSACSDYPYYTPATLWLRIS